MKLLILLILLLNSFFVTSGEITIEKKSVIIRNDLFKEKQNRAEEYKHIEYYRALSNQLWLYRIPIDCGYLGGRYLFYGCNIGLFYKDHNINSELEYWQPAPLDIFTLEKP